MYSTYFFFRISIHAPREGGDTDYKPMAEGYSKFQSTPPARGATRMEESCNITPVFQSTPPARGATIPSGRSTAGMIFQSTPPARGATSPTGRGGGAYRFQSTPPARGATRRRDEETNSREISIHAPREGGDV